MRVKVVYVKYAPNFISHLDKVESMRVKKNVIDISEELFKDINEVCASYHSYTSTIDDVLYKKAMGVL